VGGATVTPGAAVDRPGLDRLWDRAADRLQRNGLRPAGTLRLDGLDRDERHALAGLLGRPIAHDRVAVDLADLDRRLREAGVATGLVGAVERRRGPLVDRPGQRQARADAAARVWATARRALAEAGLGGEVWVEPWLDDVRRSGALGRARPVRAERAVAAAARCLAALPAVAGETPCGRGELASLVTGDAHGLDDGALVSSLVLRAVAARDGTPYPASTGERRRLWRAVGVLTDEVSTTALTAGLRAGGAGDASLDERTAAGWETHLTLRDLRRFDVCAPGGEVYVCENPRVLEAAADAGCRRALVCTQGQPVLVVTTLLGRLARDGAVLHYHGDFDWPGVAIANPLIDGLGCRPWRFTADHYLAALARTASSVDELPPLTGAPVGAAWDAGLTEAMAAAGRAVHEELVLADLLADLLADWR